MLRTWVLSLLALSLAAPSAAATRRMALVVGNNAGGGERPPLRYAEHDAGKMARVMVELGDVAPEDLLLLQGRGLSGLQRAFTEVRERVAKARGTPDTRAVVLFYYSGHSDGEALELGKERLSFAQLKAMLQGTGADLRVAVIDACKSGSAVKPKGVRVAPAFTIHLNDALTATGEAFITSSAADEAALESEELRGSFFTHNLVSGLRGAADLSGDGLITLGEAYRYAHDRTIAATALLGTSQHPNYDYQLSGQGEFVLASLHRTVSWMELPSGADRALVTDLTRDQVVAELPRGAARELALPPGRYGVRVARGGESFGARYQLVSGTRQVVRWEDLSRIDAPNDRLAMKGGVDARLNADRAAARGGTNGLFTLQAGAIATVATELGWAANLRLSYERARTSSWTVALQGSAGGLEAASRRELGLQARAGYRFVLEAGRLGFFLGGEGGLAFVSQAVDGGAPLLMLAPVLSPRAGARLWVAGPLTATVEAELPLLLGRVDDALRVLALPTVTAGVAFEF